MSKLFEPASIGVMQLENCFIRSSTWEGMAGINGEVTEPLLNIYKDLARGGVGLILTGGAFVSPKGQSGPGTLSVHDDALLPGLKRLVTTAHNGGSKIALQINHSGSSQMT